MRPIILGPKAPQGATGLRRTSAAGGRVSKLPDLLMLARIKAAGLPAPVQEFAFAAPQRKWRADWAWPDRLVLMEIEGAVWVRGRHTRGAGYEKDMEKHNAGQLLGYRLLRYSTGQLRGEQWLADLKRLLY